MAELCRRTSLAQETEDVQRLQEWQREFFQAHLNSWLGEFITVLTKKAGTEFYRGIAQLLRAFLEEEKEGLAAALEMEN